MASAWFSESAPSLGEDFGRVSLGSGVLAELGDLERGLSVVAGGGGVLIRERDPSAEDQGIGVDHAVIMRGREVQRALAGGKRGVEMTLA